MASSVCNTLDFSFLLSRLKSQVRNFVKIETSGDKSNGHGSLRRSITTGAKAMPVQIRAGTSISDVDGPLLELQMVDAGLLALFARRSFVVGAYILSIRGRLLVRGSAHTGNETDFSWCPKSGTGLFVICQSHKGSSNMTRYIRSYHGTGKQPNVDVAWFCRDMFGVIYACRPIAPGDELVGNFPQSLRVV